MKNSQFFVLFSFFEVVSSLFLHEFQRMPPIKRRYILFTIKSRNVDSQDDLSNIREGDIVRAVKETIQNLHGDFGSGSIIYSFNLKNYDRSKRMGIFASKRETCGFVSTALPIVSKIGKLEVSLSILKITGTLRGSVKHYTNTLKTNTNDIKKSTNKKQKEKVL